MTKLIGNENQFRTGHEHTADEALERFTLVAGRAGDAVSTACAITALAWMAGEEWPNPLKSLKSVHPILARWVIAANDSPGTTEQDRREIVRAGETGILDTATLPTPVLLAAWADAPAASDAERILAICAYITRWKAAPAPVDLTGKDFSGIDLDDADLSGKDFSGADFAAARLCRTNFSGAKLTGANFTRADLTRANFYRADKTGAVF